MPGGSGGHDGLLHLRRHQAARLDSWIGSEPGWSASDGLPPSPEARRHRRFELSQAVLIGLSAPRCGAGCLRFVPRLLPGLCPDRRIVSFSDRAPFDGSRLVCPRFLTPARRPFAGLALPVRLAKCADNPFPTMCGHSGSRALFIQRAWEGSRLYCFVWGSS